jgi:hypothetical protein
MARWKIPNSSTARRNRRGCFIVAGLLLLLIAALAVVGFNSNPINELNSEIPVLG